MGKVRFQGYMVAGLIALVMIQGKGAASAAVLTLYTQGTPNTLGSTGFSGPEYPQYIAGKFTLSQASQVQSLTWDGSYFNNDIDNFGFVSATTDNFSIYLFQDSGNTVGSLIGGAVFTGSATSRVVSPNPNLYNYAATITPTSLAAGNYWVGISNDASGFDVRWGWNASNNDLGFTDRLSLSSPTSGYSLTSNNVLVFSVLGAVPEPSAVTGLLAASGTLCLVRFRRSKA